MRTRRLFSNVIFSCILIRYMAFQFGVIHGKAKAVGKFLENGDAKRFSVSLFGLFPPLHNAVAFGRKDVLKVLLDYGFEINATFADVSPLHLAIAEEKDACLIEMLLKRGADVDMADANGWTALILAVQKNTVEIQKLLLNYGADVTKADIV